MRNGSNTLPLNEGWNDRGAVERQERCNAREDYARKDDPGNSRQDEVVNVKGLTYDLHESDTQKLKCIIRGDYSNQPKFQ